jgi:hypothetical protein
MAAYLMPLSIALFPATAADMASNRKNCSADMLQPLVPGGCQAQGCRLPAGPSTHCGHRLCVTLHSQECPFCIPALKIRALQAADSVRTSIREFSPSHGQPAQPTPAPVPRALSVLQASILSEQQVHTSDGSLSDAEPEPLHFGPPLVSQRLLSARAAVVVAKDRLQSAAPAEVPARQRALQSATDKEAVIDRNEQMAGRFVHWGVFFVSVSCCLIFSFYSLPE